MSFTIRELYLPNSEFEDENEGGVSAALGFVSHAVQLTTNYLSIPLPYPLFHQSSTSTVEDPLAIMAGSRLYPLFPKYSVPFRFDYGVFLLNKDIETLMASVGLKTLDIRHTLPNLKYLFYVLTAGRGDVPARKAGGIKGLLGGRLSARSSRRGSEEEVPDIVGKRIPLSMRRPLRNQIKYDQDFKASPPNRTHFYGL